LLANITLNLFIEMGGGGGVGTGAVIEVNGQPARSPRRCRVTVPWSPVHIHLLLAR